MFTGLVEGLGIIVSLKRRRLTVKTPFSLRGLKRGASLAVNGCCLSAVTIAPRKFSADLSPETLRLTSLGQVQTGDRVNLERPVRPTQFLGGHLVQGHIDGVGRVQKIFPRGTCKEFTFLIPRNLAKYCVAKGSIAIDGVSLTINRVKGTSLAVMIIPETLQKTNFGRLAVDQRVNLEVDIIAKYVKKLNR